MEIKLELFCHLAEIITVKQKEGAKESERERMAIK